MVRDVEPLVGIDGDGVRALDAGKPRPARRGCERGPAHRRVDVEPDLSLRRDLGHRFEPVDVAGLGRPGNSDQGHYLATSLLESVEFAPQVVDRDPVRLVDRNTDQASIPTQPQQLGSTAEGVVHALRDHDRAALFATHTVCLGTRECAVPGRQERRDVRDRAAGGADPTGQSRVVADEVGEPPHGLVLHRRGRRRSVRGDLILVQDRYQGGAGDADRWQRRDHVRAYVFPGESRPATMARTGEDPVRLGLSEQSPGIILAAGSGTVDHFSWKLATCSMRPRSGIRNVLRAVSIADRSGW